MMSNETVYVRAKAQMQYCVEHDYPLFAPRNGICWRCKQNIYSDKGYTYDVARKALITYCPHCHASFTD